MEIEVNIDSFSPSEFGFVVSTPQELWDILVRRDGYSKIKFDYDSDYSEYGPGSIKVFGIREENDKEKEYRLAKEKKEKERKRELRKISLEQQEAKERAEYEKLKKKYGKEEIV
jgi:hypothetical protein